MGGVGLREDAEVDESGAGDVGGGEAVELEMVDDFLGQGARVGFAQFGEHHGGVRLVITEAEIGGGGDGGGCGFAESGGEGGGKAGFEFLENRHGERGSSMASRLRGGCPGRFGIENGEDFIAGLRVAELAADFAIGKHFRDGSERPQVEVVILTRDDEEDDIVDGRIIDGFKVDACFRATEDGGNLFEIV